MQAPAALDRLLAHARGDDDVVAVVLFGSAARGEPARDTDVAVLLRPGFAGDVFDKQLEYAEWSSGRRHQGLDPSVFQALPLYVRESVLQDAKPLLVKDEDALYEVAMTTIRAMDEFRPHLDMYLDEVADAWS